MITINPLEKPSIIEQINSLEEAAFLKSAIKIPEKRVDALEKAQ